MSSRDSIFWFNIVQPYIYLLYRAISISLHGPALSNPERAVLFIACISACPNLTSLKIVSLRVDRPAANTVTLRKLDYLHVLFRAHTLPSIRKVVLPDMLAPILSSFPRVQGVMCGENTPAAGFRLMQAAKSYCPHLEEVGFWGSTPVAMIKWISMTTPNIQRLVFRNSLTQVAPTSNSREIHHDFALMRKLTNLSYLEFGHRTNTDGHEHPYLSLHECVKNARALLSLSRNPKPKIIKVKTLRGQTDAVEKVTVISMP
ncbi:hypothetical protein DFH06DRAFT_1121994 [Mycena polygramma]|nr:hypothetical protein DFH06DRAFT_1121994 [Mycena polygramma]